MKLATHPYWQNFKDVWAGGTFPTYMKNSLVVTGGSIILILLLSLGAGFVFDCQIFWRKG